MRRSTKSKYTLTLDNEVIAKIDSVRGLATRSIVVNDLLKRKLAEGKLLLVSYGVE